MKKMSKYVTTGLLGMTLLGSLAGCGGAAESDTDAASSESGYDETITIDVYNGLANYMGMQEGWFAKIVRDKFNMELNIIAPNVAGNGDTLYQTRTAAGDLGDLIIVDNGQQYNELVEAGLLTDASEYYETMENVQRFDAAVQNLNKDADGLYGFPTSVSTLKATDPSEGLDPTFGAYVRWDLYGEQGYPEIGTLEDLLPVIQKMQEDNPTTDSGKKVYGFSLFSDWDGNMMNAGKQLVTYYGYDESGFVLAKADGSDYQSILDSDSEYIRALKFYFQANQMGLVDPESTTQNYDTLFAKFQEGQVLFSWWPWLGQAAFNTTTNLNEGKGFMLAPIQDQKIFSYGAEVYGGKQFIGIGSNAEDPERIAAFIDWLYSSEGVLANSSQTSGSSGPEGLTWEMKDGEPVLTEFGKQALLDGDGDVPEEYGGGSYKDGVSALNVNTVLPIDINPDTGFPYAYTMWESYQNETTDPVKEDWSKNMGGAESTIGYLEENDQLLVAPGASYVAPEDSSEISTLRNQAKATIIEYSWRMVFAKDEAEFDQLLKEMQETADGLGYQTVLEFDMNNAKDQNEKRVEVAKEFGD
ncbi:MULTISPECIES: ABC transporter substrate-binding protein [Enterococcus]|jgi:multiple sugar transport system substrate-binding protein/putative aldouronate transport system substrate-binding protein|uniref:ABC transporter substrate-binding protein n=1 Tax=Enterococcus TaxID=1350 RepID=UPI0009BD2775|nr:MULTISPECIES: ABC transporter substrate-binding protein [Enterococcus]OQO88176.1 ABC transporter substrate-binding protein [Enterococcus casseliflavus]MBK0037123.1 ABC transporter substrate-binding protein [Enterococcus sp. S52]MBK0069786.1 ABC transporter substrate-binding protein [Enterococcus sp. S53]MBK0140379.1 ABC transporter substrate-binding protein [Enterococcus sp. S76]MBK0143948.1 ABC transporter substrate-binding protein [Enterococcus sp. S77]